MPYLVQLKAPSFPQAILRDGPTMRRLSHKEAVVYDDLPAFAKEDRTLHIQKITVEKAVEFRAYKGKIVLREIAQYEVTLVPEVTISAAPVAPPTVAPAPPVVPTGAAIVRSAPLGPLPPKKAGNK